MQKCEALSLHMSCKVGISASVSMRKFSLRIQDVLLFHDVVWFGF